MSAKVKAENIDRNFRNLGVVLILIAVLLLAFWMVNYLRFPKRRNLALAYIGVALLLGGILLVTRIQFIMWMEKRAQ